MFSGHSEGEVSSLVVALPPTPTLLRIPPLSLSAAPLSPRRVPPAVHAITAEAADTVGKNSGRKEVERSERVSAQREESGREAARRGEKKRLAKWRDTGRLDASHTRLLRCSLIIKGNSAALSEELQTQLLYGSDHTPPHSTPAHSTQRSLSISPCSSDGYGCMSPCVQ